MKKYDNYKDSGIEWIGEIPEHWEMKKIKHLTKLQGGYAFKSDLFSNEGTPIIRIGDISTNINFDECKKIDDDTIPKEYWLDQYDTLIALSGATTGKTCFVNNIPPKAYINQRVARIMFSNKLLYYVVNSGFFQEQILLTASGSAQENISNSQIENLEISISNTPEEQTAIANYLDRKTAEIDELIADKKRLLELYEEEKTAIINQAVTKGINPNAPMKDSGIEWLGEIPEHWQIANFNHYVFLRHGYQFRNFDFTSDGIKIIKITQLLASGKFETEKVSFIDENRLDNFKDILIKEGDILMALTGGTIGKIIRVPKVNEPLLQNYRVGNFFPINEQLSKDFLFWILSSNSILAQIFYDQRETGQPNIGKEDFGKMKIVFPKTIDEQTEIVKYIQAEIYRIDAKVNKIKKLIDLLTEYRTALISEVVTGKIKVV